MGCDMPDADVVPNGEMPFTLKEYQERFRNVREEMARRGIDLLYVTSPPNLCYLTGHELIWYTKRSPMGLAIRQDSEGFMFFDGAGHKSQTLESTIMTEADSVFFPRRQSGDPLGIVVKTLKDKGWLKGTAAVERWSWSPTGPTMDKIAEAMTSAGAHMVDGSWVVDRVRLVKSPQEIRYVRKAVEIANKGMEAVRQHLREGVTEMELAGAIYAAMTKEGGEEAGLRHMVHSGPRSAHFHGASTHRKIQAGEVVWIDFCGVYNRYHGDLGRTFSIGEPPKRPAEMMKTAAGSIKEVVKTARPGIPMKELGRVANDYINDAELGPYVWFVGGYSLGLDIPPDWVGHVNLGDYGAETSDYLPGMVTNYENLFEVEDERFGCGYIDTLLMTEDGPEVLTDFPREIVVV